MTAVDLHVGLVYRCAPAIDLCLGACPLRWKTGRNVN